MSLIDFAKDAYSCVPSLWLWGVVP